MLHSRQIRPPIYSLKQNKLRKTRVVRYAALYLCLLIVFVGLIAGPIAYSNMSDPASLLNSIPSIGDFVLIQPNHQDRNNTSGYTSSTTTAAATTTVGA